MDQFSFIRNTTIYKKSGSYNDAKKDFYDSDPLNIKDISNEKRNGFTGILPDGRSITVRSNSSDSRPTIEIRDLKSKKEIKIRYGEK